MTRATHRSWQVARQLIIAFVNGKVVFKEATFGDKQ